MNLLKIKDKSIEDDSSKRMKLIRIDTAVGKVCKFYTTPYAKSR